MPDSQPPRKPRRGDVLEGVLERYDRRGAPRGRTGDYSFSLKHGVPGDRWSFTVHKRRRDHLDGRALELLEPGIARVPARCRHSGACGGCAFQECDYGVQLEEKRRLVGEAIEQHMPSSICEVEPVLPCEEPWAYRNKMEYSFATRRWVAPGEPQGARADFALGLHARGLYLKVVDLEECPILFEGGEAILRTVRERARARELPLWDVREHAGLLRHLVLRRGVRTGQTLVNLVTSAEARELVDPFATELLAAHPEVTTFVHSIHSGKAAVARGERERVLHGPGWIEEELGGLRFRISAGSFFQTNTLQAERLFELVRAEAALSGEETVYDLYAGAGTIALLLAPSVREVVAFEQVPEAVADARENAERAGLANLSFVEGDVLAELDASLGEGSRLPAPDVVVVDPPRAGLHPKVLPKLLELAPRRIVYVSCNVQSGARDAALLVEGGYALERVQAVDLFPHTPHVECVLTLEGRGATLEP